MANQTVLEELVVRLIGEGSSYFTMMTKAPIAADRAAKQVMASLNKLEQFAGTLLGTFGALGVAASLRGAFDQFAKLERGQIRLNAIIETNGGNVAELTARYREVAEAISSVTLNTKGEILSLFQMAEAQQFSGDAAENVVRNAVAMAGATGQEASSLMRVAAMMQRGHPEMAKRMLGLQGVTSGSELVDAITRKMAGGMALAQAEFNSASGKMERLGRSLKSVGTEVGGLIAGALLPLVDFVQHATEQFKLLDSATKKVVYQVVGLTIAWLGMGPVTSVLRGLLGPIINLVYWLGITLPLTLVNVAAFVLWKTVMLAFKLIVLGVNAAIVLFNITVSALSVALSIATGAFGLLMGVVGFAGFMAIVGAWELFKGIISSIAALARSVTTAFEGMYAATKPLSVLGDLFTEWWTILKQVYEVAKTDLPGAWNLLSAGAGLAVSQIKDLFPPLWQYVKDGFSLVATFMSRQIGTISDYMIQRARVALLRSLPGASDTTGSTILRDAENSLRIQTAQQAASLQSALGNLSLSLPGDSIDTANAREVVSMAQAQIAAISSRTAPAALRAGEVIGNGIKKGIHKELVKLEPAVLFGSAEALSRISEYVSNFFNPKVNGAVPGATARPGATAAAEDDMEEIAQAVLGNNFPGISRASHGSTPGSTPSSRPFNPFGSGGPTPDSEVVGEMSESFMTALPAQKEATDKVLMTLRQILTVLTNIANGNGMPVANLQG